MKSGFLNKRSKRTPANIKVSVKSKISKLSIKTPKYFLSDDYNSKITDSLEVIDVDSTNKKQFIKDYLKNINLRSKYKLIGTHADIFHCSEVMATLMLLYTKQYSKSIIVRTQDKDVFDQLDILCGVGGEFDVKK